MKMLHAILLISEKQSIFLVLNKYSQKNCEFWKNLSENEGFAINT